MGGFFSSMFAEMGARRRRMRVSMGDWGRTASSFLVFVGLFLGSVGLFAKPWMRDASPWGLWLPLVFVVGYVLIDWRRQATLARQRESERIGPNLDWATLLWSLACGVAGAAAFVIAWGAAPTWTPPDNTVSVDISP